MRIRAEWSFVGLAVLGVAAVIVGVDLVPRVETEFFFSKEDPQLRATVQIASRFPSPDQLVVRAEAPDLESEAYRGAVRDLSAALTAVDGVTATYSVTGEDSTSPLWGRLLLNPVARATNLILQVDDTDPSDLVSDIEAVLKQFDRPDFALEVSGVPYVVELIRRSLFRDFVIFSISAFGVFSLVLLLVYRQWRMVLGTLTTCLIACAVTLSLTHLLNITIGLLTANIVTIVFVLTLSHIVFLTSNWKRIAGAGPSTDDSVSQAMRVTFGASIWCMVTTLLGFLSLLLASARPLRELGLAGAIGTLTALIVAFTVYPTFLRGLKSPRPLGAKSLAEPGLARRGPFPTQNRWRWLLGIATMVVVLSPGVLRLETDPTLLSYFKRGSDLREGLEAIDRDGGSSILNIVVRDGAGGGIDTDRANEAMWAFQDALEADSAVGVVLSPAVVLAHARQQPLGGLLGWGQLLSILETPLFNRIALAFVTPDHHEGLFFLRMRESRRAESREAVVTRMRGYAAASGLDVVMTGGVYELQAQLGQLIARSLRVGLGGLILLFVGIAFVVSRSARVTGSMVACLIGIPLVVLGTMGYLQLPVDIITSPAANIALAMGVDSMIHLVTRARRLAATGVVGWDAWKAAREQQWQPILGATLTICAGFGIFSLSAFPPTQRFGIAVILGTATAATMTLIALPFAATRRAAYSTPSDSHPAGRTGEV